jgi:PKD repeat protein
VAVNFDGSGSSDADGNIVRYDWDFGDGNTAPDGGPNPSNTYAVTDVYDVVLTVTDNDGDIAKTATQAVIGDGINLPPTADPGGPGCGREL